MTPAALTQQRGLEIAHQLKDALVQSGVPVENVYLFGSLADPGVCRGNDIDIAVIYRSFLADPIEEHRHIARARSDFSVPIDIVCLYSDALENPYSTIAKEIKEHGIAV